MRKLVMLLGEPGSGKTTVARSVIAALRENNNRAHEHKWKEVYATLYLPSLIGVVGTYKGDTFDGTDKLALHTQPQALEMLKELPSWAWFVEGDRYATPSFLDTAESLGELRVASLVVLPRVLEARRAERATKQDPIWLKGRHTKFVSLTGMYGAKLFPHNRAQDTLAVVNWVLGELGLVPFA